MFSVKPQGMPSGDHIKVTGDPGPRNSVIAGARMISATAPKFSVPYADAESQEQTDEVERLAARVWQGAGMVGGKPLEFTMGLSAMLYGEIHARYRLVSDMITLETNKIRKARLERIKMITPVLIEVMNPKNCHVLKDETGLTSHLLTRKMEVNQARGLGGKAQQQLESRADPKEAVEVNELFDLENHVVWIQGQTEPFLLEVLKGNLPIKYADVEGSELFNLDPDMEATQPFLYGLYKSNVWNRQNLLLTILFSNFYALGANPQLVANVKDISKDLVVDGAIAGSVLLQEIGETIKRLPLEAFTNDYSQAFGMLNQMEIDSTMYKTVMGEAPGAGTSYSLGALLSQNGRQALIPYANMCKHVAGSLMTDLILDLKNLGGSKALVLGGVDKAKSTFDLKLIPDNLIIEANFKVSLPVDERANAQMAVQMTQGPRPLMDYATAREKFLDIGDSTSVDKKILAEKYADFKTQMLLAQKQAQMQQQLQGQMQPQGQPGIPPQGPGPQDLQNATPGLPMAEPQMPGQTMGSEQLPPELMGQGAPPL
jgi:hypothetical protein